MNAAKIALPNSPYILSGRADLFIQFLHDNAIQVSLENNADEADYIFLYPNHLYEMYKLCDRYKDKVLILIGIESMVPDFNLFDYSIGTNNLTFEDRYCRFQYELLGVNPFGHQLKYPKSVDLAKSLNRKFCNFIYSNPKAHPNRDTFFHQLSKYKKVDSLGKHLRNVDRVISEGFKGDWFGESVKEKSAYKFSISFENLLANECNTEKIISSMNANTIPIYWGDPNITKYYNPKSFINCHAFNSFTEVVEFVKELDEDDVRYCKMLSEEWRTPEQVELVSTIKKEVITFITNILNQDYNQAFRKPIGTFHANYRTYHASDNKTFKRWEKKLHHKAHLIRKRIGF